MISLAPNSSPAETTSMFHLLAVIADPAAAKRRLEELFAEKQASLEAAEKASSDAAGADEAHAAASAKLAEAQAISHQFSATHETRSKQLSDHEQVLQDKQARLDSFEASLSEREAAVNGDLKSREDAVSAREAEVGSRESVVRGLTDSAQALKEHYERSVASLRAAINPGPVAHVMNAETGIFGITMGEAK